MSIPEQQQTISSEQIKSKAKLLGFFDCGISKAGYLPEEAQRMESWLGDGLHADMKYLEKNKEKRYNPKKLVEGARSVITVLYAYNHDKKLPEEDNFKLSVYAYGADYHKVVKDKLYDLLNIIENATGKRKARVFADSAPVLDRAWAQKSGLGFIGKNTMLINRQGGSFFFIGHIIIDLELENDEQRAEKNFCGSCTLCIKACPTGALKPFQLDSNKCISYQTIENKEDIDSGLKGKMEDWIFGCDICQDVCPWNRNAVTHNEPLFLLSDALKKMKKKDWNELTENKFQQLFNNSPVKRAGYDGLKRNIRFLND